jgi:hypothetical protein
MNPPTDLVIAGPTPNNAPTQDESRRPRNPDDGILSAKELAAAFQLDFNPQVEPTMPSAPVARQHRPPRVFKTLVVLIFLAAIGAGAAIYVKPEYRAKANVWMNHAFASSKHYLASTVTDKKSSSAKSTAEKSATPANSSADASNTSSPATPADSTVTNTQSTQAPLVTSAPNPQTPTPSADHSQPDQTAAANTPAPQNPTPAPSSPPPVTQQNPPTPAPAPATPPQQAPAAIADQTPAALQQSAEEKRQARLAQLYTALGTQDAGSLPIDQQKSLEDTLFHSALDAEEQGDYPQAIKCYKKIQELDKSVQNTNVAEYLKYDQEHLPK